MKMKTILNSSDTMNTKRFIYSLMTIAVLTLAACSNDSDNGLYEGINRTDVTPDRAINRTDVTPERAINRTDVTPDRASVNRTDITPDRGN